MSWGLTHMAKAIARSTAIAPLIAARSRRFAADDARRARRRSAPTPVIQVAASEATSRFVPLGIGKSVVIDLPRDIKDVLVADPKIANAVIRSSRRAYMIGVTVGQTNIFFFDAEGQQIAGFDIAVTRDLNGMRAALKQSHAGRRHPRRRRRRRRHADRHRPRARAKRSRPSISRRGWSATAPRSSTASPCAAATRSCSR